VIESVSPLKTLPLQHEKFDGRWEKITHCAPKGDSNVQNRPYYVTNAHSDTITDMLVSTKRNRILAPTSSARFAVRSASSFTLGLSVRSHTLTADSNALAKPRPWGAGGLGSLILCSSRVDLTSAGAKTAQVRRGPRLLNRVLLGETGANRKPP
jgi:hypothetical protein